MLSKKIFIVSLLLAATSAQNSVKYRPCPNFNPVCISQWLASKSYCRPTIANKVQEPFYIPIRLANLPVINTTSIRNDIRYYNILNGRIEEFFVDYVNGYTVLSTEYTNLTITVGQVRNEQNRRANIPQVEISPTRTIFPRLAITTVFPATSGLDLKRSRSSSFRVIGQDPTIESNNAGPILQADIENVRITAREASTSTSPLVNRLFIQNVLCDFGIGPNDNGISV